MLDNTSDQTSTVKTNNLVVINGDASWTHSTNSQIKFKPFKVKLIWLQWCKNTCEWNYVIWKDTLFEGAVANNFNKNEIFKNCIPFTDCINKINNAHADNATDIHIVMLIYNLIKYSNNY